jgi:hypothetical protein
MMRRAVVVTLVVLLGAAAGRAQAQTPEERINRGLARAREVGIPVELLERKIAEGKAKGVSMERIAAAVERRQQALEHASQALRGQRGVEAPDLAVAADAVEAGVSDAALRAIADAAPRDRRVVAIAVLGQLVQSGQAPDAALDRVRAALARGPDALASLAAEASRGRRPGTAPPDTRGRRDPPGRGRQIDPPEGVPAPGQPPQSNRPAAPPGRTRGQGQGPSR